MGAIQIIASREEGSRMADLDLFLRQSERRAYRIALSAIGNNEEAMDIVQDSMLKLSRLYANKTEQEWRILFYRILQSRIRDWYRRQKVRNAVFSWFGNSSNEESDTDPIQSYADPREQKTENLIHQEQLMLKLDDHIKQLPTRQREAFYLRCWEGMSTLETAKTMNISEGSVKTHYSRAIHSLRAALGEDR